MRRIGELLARVLPKSGPTPPFTPPASGFLTIGSTTYIDPHGIYPLDHRLTGSPTLVINDTDQPVTIVTERNRDHPPAAPPPHRAPTDLVLTPVAELVLAPGERTETRRGDGVHVV
ncbi:hypothetical protein [Streptomyces sp. NPDC059008]|uniref:hypothetical protein n=1 Tax=Streptomyces sp. NPDC059008 TaxID=3346693 RepID=UPI00367861E4